MWQHLQNYAQVARETKVTTTRKQSGNISKRGKLS
jgi:hypothetical protein